MNNPNPIQGTCVIQNCLTLWVHPSRDAYHGVPLLCQVARLHQLASPGIGIVSEVTSVPAVCRQVIDVNSQCSGDQLQVACGEIYREIEPTGGRERGSV